MQPQDRRQTEFFSPEWVQKAMLRPSAFSMWLEGLNIGGDARQVLADYCVGGTARDVVVQGVNYGRAVVFWLIDEQQRVHDAKLMAYRNDGHRVQGWANTMRSICERSHVGPQLQNTEKVLFGQHLIPRYPDKTVCIVESEKHRLSVPAVIRSTCGWQRADVAICRPISCSPCSIGDSWFIPTAESMTSGRSRWQGADAGIIGWWTSWSSLRRIPILPISCWVRLSRNPNFCCHLLQMSAPSKHKVYAP